MKYNLNQSYHSIYAEKQGHTTFKYVLGSVLFFAFTYVYSLTVMYVIGKLFYGMF